VATLTVFARLTAVSAPSVREGVSKKTQANYRMVEQAFLDGANHVAMLTMPREGEAANGVKPNGVYDVTLEVETEFSRPASVRLVGIKAAAG